MTKKEIDAENEKRRERQEHDDAMRRIAEVQDRKRREQERENDREQTMKTPKW